MNQSKTTTSNFDWLDISTEILGPLLESTWDRSFLMRGEPLLGDQVTTNMDLFGGDIKL